MKTTGIDFAKTFANLNNATAAAAEKEPRPKAQFWLNIGVLSNVQDDNGELRFVSLAQGIALDTMQTLPTNGKSDFAQFQAARNDLRDQLLQAASNLKPGESAYIKAEGGLSIQVRRVGEETTAVVNDENPFRVKLSLTASQPATAAA